MTVWVTATSSSTPPAGHGQLAAPAGITCFSALAGLLFYAGVRFFYTQEDDKHRFYIPFGPAIALVAFLLLL